jgi:hypothetical protein
MEIVLKPYYQGQIDVFCAIYAVINALALICGIRAGTARGILHETLLNMAGNPAAFRQQLDQSMEYHDLVDQILNRELQRHAVLVRTPFGMDKTTAEDLWQTLARWLEPPKRAAILRFVRPLSLPGEPLIRHWTTVRRIRDGGLELFDCSLERHATRAIDRASIRTGEDGLHPGLIYVDPSSIRLLAPAAPERH